MKRILIVDDELGLVRTFAKILAGEGHEVAGAASLAEATALLTRRPQEGGGGRLRCGPP